MSDPMAQQSKVDRRKEQNRRAQANHRKRQQQRLRYLEERIGFLDQIQTPSADHAAGSLSAGKYDAETCDILGTLDAPLSAAFTNLESHAHFLESSIIQPTDSGLSADHLSWPDAAFDRDTDKHAQDSEEVFVWDTFDALASNAKLLGLSNEALIKSVSKSSFYSPLSSLDYSAVPKALRPNIAQLTYQHHPYIDCIPLSDLRSRIILAINHKPPLVCPMDIWTDILLGGISSGPTPTDSACWRITDAFSEKWKTLLSYDIGTLMAQTLSSNPPLRVIIPS